MMKKYNFVTWLRAFGVILILLCHFTQQSDNIYLNLSAQFFNIGVPIFFILSGFLFGVRGGQHLGVVQFYCKRIKRIYIPYEFFVIVLLIVHLLYGKNIVKIDWLYLVLGVQGSVVGVLGAEQTWFITAVLICYLFTPVISLAIEWIERKQIYVISVITLLSLPVIVALFPEAFVSTLFTPLCIYMLAYIMGYKFYTIHFSDKNAVLAFLIMILLFCLRIVVRYIADGTILYDRVIAGYTNNIAAFCIFYIFSVVFEKRNPSKVITFINNISFEIYLCHYMFTVGPISLFGITPYWILDCSLTTVVTIVLAVFINKLASFIMMKLE